MMRLSSRKIKTVSLSPKISKDIFLGKRCFNYDLRYCFALFPINMMNILGKSCLFSSFLITYLHSPTYFRTLRSYYCEQNPLDICNLSLYMLCPVLRTFVHMHRKPYSFCLSPTPPDGLCLRHKIK